MSNRKRTSCIWNISIDKLKEVIDNSNSFSDVLRHFDLVIASGNYKTLKTRLKEENIDFSHIPQGLNNNKNRKFPNKSIPLEEVMIENSTYSRKNLKERLLNENILENKCVICNQLPIHNKKKLVMVLDHINGKNNDHRKENLRLLCPNCNSQQETFCGKNKRKKHYYCGECGKSIKSKHSKLCHSCHSKNMDHISIRKVKDRPSVEQLLKEIEESNYCAVGRKYGVSDNAVRKWVGSK